jgi:hypothetical protein
MFRQATIRSSIDRTTAKGAEQGELTLPAVAGSTASSQPIAEPTDCVRGRNPLPALMAVPPQAATPARLPAGMIVFLFFMALVATGTIGVFFGVGLLSLVKPTEAMMPRVASSGSSDRGTPLAVAFSRSSDNSLSGDDKATSAPRQPAPSESAAVAALPPVISAQLSSPDIEAQPRPSDAALATPIADGSSSIVGNASSEREMPHTRADAAAAEPPASTVVSSEPGAEAPAAAVPQPARLVLSAAEVRELLVRGDAFLHRGDLTSARLFYERAANAGNGDGAMRMGATFDPSFLGRAGPRGAQGDPAKAQLWYRKALDLSVAEVQHQSNAVEER